MPAPSVPPLALGMRLASAGVAVVLAVVVIGDLSDAGGGSGGDGAATLESADQSQTTMEFAAEGDTNQEDSGAAVPVPDVSDATEGFAAQPPADDATSTSAPRVGNEIAACPSRATGATAEGGTSAGGAGGPSSGGGGAVTGATAEAPAATPTPQPAATLRQEPGLESKVTCEEQAIAGAVTPTTSAPETGPARDTNEESLSAAGALPAAEEGGVSTLRVVEIALAGALIALLAGVAVELALRGRAA